MAKIWEECKTFRDRWAGVPISITACCEISERNGGYYFGLKFSNIWSKEYPLVQQCYSDDFSYLGLTIEFRACIRDLAITNNSVSGRIVLQIRLCAPIVGCSTWQTVGTYRFDVRFLTRELATDMAKRMDRTVFTPEEVTSAGLVPIDVTSYELEILSNPESASPGEV
jgi:hypothetical protein